MSGRRVLLLIAFTICGVGAFPIELNAPSGTITNPGYPGYDSNSGESWKLRVTGATSYTLYFDEFDLDIEACWDYLVLYNDDNYLAPGVNICEQPSEPYVMPSGKMTINFMVASNAVAGQRGDGFVIRYVASGPGIEPPPTVPTPPPVSSTTAGVVITEEPSTTQKPSTGEPSITGQQSTTKNPATNPPSGLFPPGTQDDSQCGAPAIPPTITGLDYVAQAASLSSTSYRQPSVRVVNGEEAVPHSWPWQAAIQGSAYGSNYCGGTLVQPQWVVTAAHCAALVFIGTYSGDKVLLGAHDKREEEASRQVIDIAAKYVHPQYDNPDRSHDVALLKLKQPAQLNEYVSLACEAHEGWAFPADMQCVVTGWGVTKEGGNVGTNILQQAPLPLMSDPDCYDLYQQANLDTTPDMQCAGGQSKGACNGDSGGPLNCYVNNRWYHMGIVSFGEANCDTDIASVYAKVAMLRQFIDDTIAANS